MSPTRDEIERQAEQAEIAAHAAGTHDRERDNLLTKARQLREAARALIGGSDER